eukprot:49825-Rhodomonas_salina.1
MLSLGGTWQPDVSTRHLILRALAGTWLLSKPAGVGTSIAECKQNVELLTPPETHRNQSEYSTFLVQLRWKFRFGALDFAASRPWLGQNRTGSQATRPSKT